MFSNTGISDNNMAHAAHLTSSLGQIDITSNTLICLRIPEEPQMILSVFMSAQITIIKKYNTYVIIIRRRNAIGVMVSCYDICH